MEEWHMSGVTKHIYERDIMDIRAMWQEQLISITKILPKNYTDEDVVLLLKKFYPHEWDFVQIKYDYYNKKDKAIKSRLGKSRYNMKSPLELLKTVSQYKHIMSKKAKEKYSREFALNSVKENHENLWKQRYPKIQKITIKIEKAKIKTQQVTPEFIDKMIGLYERKNTTQKDKMYILAELKKYYNRKTINFFFKLNDTELNKQLREIAFFHLQSFNYKPRLRKQKYMQVHTKNKKRKKYMKEVYPNETYNIPQNPVELEYRIENGKEQKIKEFDYFISHSSKDSSYVQKLISYENSHGKNIFCDWINDIDYLKRHLLCNATLKVLEKRLEQSKAIIFVSSPNSIESKWCRYELNYFDDLGRDIYTIDRQDIEKGEFNLKPIEKSWFKNDSYREDAFLQGEKITS